MACARERVRRRRSRRRWRACAVRVCACVRALCAGAVAGAAPHARAWLRARAAVAGFDAAPRHEAGPSVQMMRVRFCLEAAEKPSYPAAYGMVQCLKYFFWLLLSYVARPPLLSLDDGLTGNPARRVAPGLAIRVAGRRDGSGRRPFAFFVLPLCRPRRRLPSHPRRARDALQSWHSSPRVA